MYLFTNYIHWLPAILTDRIFHFRRDLQHLVTSHDETFFAHNSDRQQMIVILTTVGYSLD
jgi:hypothetical protein